jgi:carbon-monoxide dehydrogenase medium subunit
MIPQEFDYSVPTTIQEALSLIGGGERKPLAGGMSLIPMMKLRLATPEHVVDLGRVPELTGLGERDGLIVIGAMTTHHEVETSPVVRAHAPLLASTAGHIGDAQVRNMGTIGGSIAHADPAADYPAALLALDAQVRMVSGHSDRKVAAAEYFLDAFTTALEPGELITDVLVPAQDITEGSCYEKLAHPASGFAVVGIAARVQKTGGKVTLARIGVTGLAGRAFRARNSEAILESGGTVADAVAVLGEGEEPNSDLFASADYRLHLARVHAARALGAALSRAV